MRRAPAAIAAAAAGLGGVLAFHTNRSAAILSVAPSSTAPSPATVPAGGSTTPSTTTVPAGGVRTATGAEENYGYGVLAVRVTVRGQRITDVAIANLQAPEPYSQSLAAQAIPILRNEVLQAQSAQINALSGATYTSEGYAYSLQSALDKLHMK